MMFPRRARRLTRVHLGLLLSGLLASSLGAAFLNLSFATLRRAGGLVSLDRALLSLSGTVVTLLALHVLLSLGVLAVYRGFGRFRFIPLVVWSGSTVLLVGALAPIWDLTSETLPTGGWVPVERLMVVGAVWSAVVFFPILAYLVARRFRNSRRAGHFFRGFLVSAPLLGLETFFFVWGQVFWIHGMLSPRSLLWTSVYFLAAVATLFAGSWIAQHRSALPALIAVTLALLASPWILRTLEPEHPPAAAGTAAAQTPCVVLLTVDTLRADTLAPFRSDSRDPVADGASAVGVAEASSPAAPTSGTPWGFPSTPAPALEALAADSTVFTGARSPSPWTKPAAASILTGVAPGVHGATDLRSLLPDEIETLAETLRAAGYRTVGIGRNTFLRDAFNFDQGFDEYQFFPRGHGGILGARMLQALFPSYFATEPSSEQLTDFAIDWLRGHRDAPFFLWLHYFDPHGPFAPPARFLPAEQAAVGIGTMFSDTAAIRNGELVPDLEEREWIRQLYRAEVRHVSEEIGRVSRALVDLGLYDRCLIAFTSDHGEEFWEHGGFEHGHTLYEELLRVPLSIKSPHHPASAGRTVAIDVSTESVTPTILDLLGIEADPRRFSAPSLAEWLRADSALGSDHPRSPMFAGAVHYFEDEEAVLFDHLKYIREPLTGREQLFDLRADPFETRPIQDEGAIALGRRLLDAQGQRIELLRHHLGIGGDIEAELDSQTLQDLRSLGYID